MMRRSKWTDQAVRLLVSAAKQRGRNLFMAGDPRYQPKELQPYLGYDQWAGWLVITEWGWLKTQARIGKMPRRDAELLTNDRLERLLRRITTTKMDDHEYGRIPGIKATRHDILALLRLMRMYLPKRLHRYLHRCATSYDIIETAYALQLQYTFRQVFWQQMRVVDQLWRQRIRQYAYTVMAGRTHLQDALPITAGSWLAYLHSRFTDCSENALRLSLAVPGKFSGAVGTRASQKAIFDLRNSRRPEVILLKMLGLPVTRMSTQVAPPEARKRMYDEVVNLSGVLANIGEDVRLLQSSPFGEITSFSSSSSAMPHKISNPISGENVAGMHIDVIAESLKVALTLVTDLQRDLRWSCVMRSYSAVLVYAFKQLQTTERILKSMKVNVPICQRNFEASARLVVAELLHLGLQEQGFAETHKLVNETIVPAAILSGQDLVTEMEAYLKESGDSKLRRAWQAVPRRIKGLLRHPEEYIGTSIEDALEETQYKLAKAA